MASSSEIFENPLHPYTRTLLSAIPVPDPDKKRIGGLLPTASPAPAESPTGQPDLERAATNGESATQSPRELTEVSPGHLVAMDWP